MHIRGTIRKLADRQDLAVRDVLVADAPLRWSDGTTLPPEHLFLARIGPALITSCFIPIALSSSTLYVDQTYEDVETFFRIRPKLTGDTFEMEAGEPSTVPGTTVLVGGSPEGNWYHWLLNWLPRLSLALHADPTLRADPAVKFAFHANVANEPYRSLLTRLDLDPDRLVFIDPERPTIFDDLLVPTFPNKRNYYPWLLGELRSMLTNRSGQGSAPPGRRIYISREKPSVAKRRLLNSADLAPCFDRFGIETVTLEDLSGREQADRLLEAELVVGVHGAGLANLVFCRPGTKVVIIDNARNAANGISGMFSGLASACGLDHRMIIAREAIVEGVDYSVFYNLHNRDVIVDPAAIQAAISDALTPSFLQKLQALIGRVGA